MDYLGALGGTFLGMGFAPFNKKVQYEFIAQGASGKLGSTITAGAGAVLGTASLGYKAGIPIGIEKGPVGVIQESAKPYEKAYETAKGGIDLGINLAGYLPYIIIGIGALFVYGMVKKK